MSSTTPNWWGGWAGLWHGDLGSSLRRALRDELPDMDMTTPESLEATLASRRIDQERILANLQCVIIDKIRAFACDDPG